MVKVKDDLGYDTVEKFVARTFYPESAARLEKLGFQKVAELHNDDIRGRTSYYYEANANIVLSRVRQRTH